MSKYNTASHCKYLCQYHIIWCPKFRYNALQGDTQQTIKSIITDICKTYHYEIKALEIMSDHIHAFLSCPQTVAPADIARTLKSITAIRLFQEHPQLKQFYARTGTLWSKGYFITTVGNASATTIQHYIENQKASDPTR